MRTPKTLRLILLLPFVCPSALLLAQFQDPTPDELKMTSDPKAPGASAVYLYSEQTSNDWEHFIAYYERIKVLTEKGKELATVKIPYEPEDFKVTDIAGRTIHADGTIIPLTAKPADLMDFKAKGYQKNMLVFTLPSVEVGSIIEFRLRLRYNGEWSYTPTWNLQKPYFIHHAFFSYHPVFPNGWSKLMWARNLPDGVELTQGKKDIFSLDLKDISPFPDEDWMPPLNTIRYRVEFYFTSFSSGADFWNAARKSWKTWVDQFISPSKTIAEAAAGLVAPADSSEVKAQKIYTAVMKMENTTYTRYKSYAERKKEKIKDIKKAEDVWKQQSGNANELALLYVALARAAGLTAYPMQVVDRDGAMFDQSYLSLYQLDDYIAIVSLGGKDLYLDPGAKMCAYGALAWRHTVAGGLRLNDKEVEQAITPASTYKAAFIARTADLEIAADSALLGTAKIVMTGPEALYWRQFSVENDAGELHRALKESWENIVPEGVQVDFDHLDNLEAYDLPLTAVFKLNGNLGTVTGKHIFLPGQFFESHAKHPFVAQDKRLTPIDVHYPSMDQDSVTYHLPEGYIVESAPKNPDLVWPNHALMKIDSKIAERSVKVMRVSAYNFCLIEAKEYADLHGFYQKQAMADQQQLVLVRAAAPKEK
jgi:hypothetical protein